MEWEAIRDSRSEVPTKNGKYLWFHKFLGYTPVTFMNGRWECNGIKIDIIYWRSYNESPNNNTGQVV